MHVCIQKCRPWIRVHNSVFCSPVMAVTAVAEEFSKGATIRLLSDMLSFSSHSGSTESSRHLYDVPFLLFPSYTSPVFSVPSYLVPVYCIEGGFFFLFPLLPFCLAYFFSETSIKVFICDAKILITGILRSHNTAESQL